MPAPLPANGLVVFAAEPEFSDGAPDAVRYIYISREGVAPRRIVGFDGDGLTRRCPVFSPDGSMLAYSEYASPLESPGTVTLVVTDVDGAGNPTGSERQIASPTVLEPYLFCAAWSPDGRRLAYVDDAGLWVASLDGQTPDLVLESPRSGHVRYFEWAPDGSGIAVSLIGGEIGLVPVTGVDVRVLPGMDAGPVTWAPDGTRLAVRQGRTINVIEVDELGGDSSPAIVTPVGEGREDPAWSPDGKYIAFVHGGRIVLADPDGSGSTTLPPVELPDKSRPLSISAVEWSPDGQRLLVIGCCRKVLSISVDGTSPAELVSTFRGVSDLDWQAIPP